MGLASRGKVVAEGFRAGVCRLYFRAMRFQFTDEHVRQFHTLGFTVFRQILPTALIRDLRREAAKGLLLARAKHGPQAQRLQPIANYPELDPKPFQDYRELPDLVDSVRRLMGGGKECNHGSELLGIFYEPADRPSNTGWHRDIRADSPGIDVNEFNQHFLDWGWFNQINCALYDDSCTWYVPGSHLRQWDTDGEKKGAPAPVSLRTAEGAAGIDIEELERIGFDYCAAMPGSVQLQLNAGDFAFYRPLGWHLGNYAPYRKRATLHDLAGNESYYEWSRAWRANLSKPAKK